MRCDRLPERLAWEYSGNAATCRIGWDACHHLSIKGWANHNPGPRSASLDPWSFSRNNPTGFAARHQGVNWRLNLSCPGVFSAPSWRPDCPRDGLLGVPWRGCVRGRGPDLTG